MDAVFKPLEMLNEEFFNTTAIGKINCLQNVIEKRKELIYIAQEIFLGSETDMEEITAAVKKVETNYSGPGSANVL